MISFCGWQMNIRNFLLDLDGTLIDSRGDIADAIIIALSKVGLIVDGISSTLIGLPLKEIIKQIAPGLSDNQLFAVESAFRCAYDEREYKLTSLYPGTENALKVLFEQGVGLHLVTMKPERPTKRIIAGFGIKRYFGSIRCSDSWPDQKLPKREMIAKLLVEEGIAPDSAAYVGDYPEDIYAARFSGIIAIAAAYGYGDSSKISESKPDYSILSLMDLFEILKGSSLW
jgi:phosphoglycolate phosphatase